MVAQAPRNFHLTLRHFILKQRILNFYRHAIRASRGDHNALALRQPVHTHPGIPDRVARKETIAWVRQDIEHCRTIDDTVLPWPFVLLVVLFSVSAATNRAKAPHALPRYKAGTANTEAFLTKCLASSPSIASLHLLNLHIASGGQVSLSGV